MDEDARDERPLLLSYDGSAGAQNAIDRAGSLFPGRAAVVVAIWQPLIIALSSYPMAGDPSLPSDVVGIDRQLGDSASSTAAEGAERARAVGLEAESVAVESDGPIWKAILDVADERDAAVIVVGTRGLSSLKSVLLGSVSRGVVGHARRPVVVCPGPDAG